MGGRNSIHDNRRKQDIVELAQAVVKDLHAPLHMRTSAALAFVGLTNEATVPGISVNSSPQPSS